MKEIEPHPDGSLDVTLREPAAAGLSFMLHHFEGARDSLMSRKDPFYRSVRWVDFRSAQAYLVTVKPSEYWLVVEIAPNIDHTCV